MAINFEAANMAGYNNPPIEVFVITLDPDTNIATSPSKSEILNCIRRGSIPFLCVRDSDQTLLWLLPLSKISVQSSGNYELYFSSISNDTSGAYSAISIFYPQTDDTPPALGFKELQ